MESLKQSSKEYLAEYQEDVHREIILKKNLGTSGGMSGVTLEGILKKSQEE